jgi:hypothetical protein
MQAEPYACLAKKLVKGNLRNLGFHILGFNSVVFLVVGDVPVDNEAPPSISRCAGTVFRRCLQV